MVRATLVTGSAGLVALCVSGGAVADVLDRKPARVEVLFGLDAPDQGPFPSNRFAVADPRQNTCQRVSLPLPDCTTQRNECYELGLVNELDGFNVTPRVSIPFSGPIDLSTANSANIFFVSLGDTTRGGVPDCLLTPVDDCEGDDGRCPPTPGAGRVVGINQAVWDPDTNTLYAKADEILDQHARYALVVTRGVRDTSGNPVAASQAFERAITDDGDGHDDGAPPVTDPTVLAYEASLRKAVHALRTLGLRRDDVAGASVFTALSVSARLEKMRDQIESAPAPIASFKLGPAGEPTVFPVSAIEKITQNREIGVSNFASTDITTSRLGLLNGTVPGAVGQIAFGKVTAPNYLEPDTTSPRSRDANANATYSGVPPITGTFDLYFNVFIPSGPRPAGGWPVVLFGYGSNDSKDGAPFNVAAKWAQHGLATLACNIIGHGQGPNSTLSVTITGQPPLTFPSGGRAVDLNGDHKFDTNEGSVAVGDGRFLLFNRDEQRQSTADFITLVRSIEGGMDVDGDGTADLDPSRIYLVGFSLAAGYAPGLFVLEPKVRAAVIAGVGATAYPEQRPPTRAALGAFFRDRQPTLINPPGTTPLVTSLGGLSVDQPWFNENIPARDQPPLVNTVPGALALQNFFERKEWLQANTAPGSFAPYMRLQVPGGAAARPFIIQEMRGDQQIPNPGTEVLARQGRFADRVTLYRHDLFPNRDDLTNPHTMILRTDRASLKPVAVDIQEQIGAFFESDGANTIDPDGAGALFEVPAAVVPTDFGYIP